MTVSTPPRRIYLDNNATTRIDPRVADTIDTCYRSQYANPASAHAEGQRARQALSEARDEIGRILGAAIDSFPPDTLVLTSGGTEANNLALLGLSGNRPGRILISSVEHPSVREAAQWLGKRGFQLHLLPVDRAGRIPLEEYRKMLVPETRLVSVIWGNNETGVLQDVEAMAAIAADRGVPFHTDAVQVVGKRDIHFQQLGATALSFSAHKFHGPTGVGGLLLRGKTTIEPILHGGAQQLGWRPGTESVPLAVGMCRALQLWETESLVRQRRMQQLRDRLEAGLIRRLAGEDRLAGENRLTGERRLAGEMPGLAVHGLEADRLPQTLNISFLGLDRQALLLALDQAGLACSTGSACTSGSSEPSLVLLSMGCSPAMIESALRLSLSAQTTTEEIDLAIDRIVRVVNDLRDRTSSSFVT